MSIFCFGVGLPSIIFSPVILPQSVILPSQGESENLDKRKLRNNWTYLAEGKGGLGVLLGEKEAMVLRILGQPTRRSYTTLEELYFERRTFTGIVFLYHGLVTRLRFEVFDRGSDSLKWKTALNLRQEMLENLAEHDARKVILNHYGNPPHLSKRGSLLIYSRGILFVWTNGKLRYIEIFEPWSAPEYK